MEVSKSFEFAGESVIPIPLRQGLTSNQLLDDRLEFVKVLPPPTSSLEIILRLRRVPNTSR
jgi:hypothetical protein